MRYVEGFVVPVFKNKLAAYKRISRKFGKICHEYGAVEYREYVADDVKSGKWTSFPQAVNLKSDEVVVFSWIAYKSRAQRDRINAKVMSDPRILAVMNSEEATFDPKRIFRGGFKLLVAV